MTFDFIFLVTRIAEVPFLMGIARMNSTATMVSLLECAFTLTKTAS